MEVVSAIAVMEVVIRLDGKESKERSTAMKKTGVSGESWSGVC